MIAHRCICTILLLGIIVPLGVVAAGKTVPGSVVQCVCLLYLIAFWLIAAARKRKKLIIDHVLIAGVGMTLFPWMMRFVYSTDAVLAMIIK